MPDSLENTTCTNPYDADTDDDGILDGWEDANHDGTVDTNETDPCNTDTDGDGVQDGTELGYTLENIGLDTDMGIFQPDLDPLSLTNPLNSDTDGDNVIDGEEDLNHNGRVDSGETDPNEPNIDYVDTVIITKAGYESTRGRLFVVANSTLGRSATLTVTAHHGTSSEVLGTLKYRKRSGNHKRTFRGVNPEPDAITVESSNGGSDYALVTFR